MTTSKTPQTSINNVDGIMEQMLNQLPIADGEILYKAEIDSQVNIYLGVTVLGVIMFIVSTLLEIKVW